MLLIGVAFAVAGWLLCGILGAIVGSYREATVFGGALGLLFGPIGIVVAFALDGRRACSQCRGKVARGAVVCPHCHARYSVPAGEEQRIARATTDAWKRQIS